MSEVRDKASVFGALPPPWPHDPLPEIREKLARSPRKVVVLDDDPTGTQTVRDLAVVTCWDAPTLAAELDAPAAGFFVLTNSRSLTVEATRALHSTLARNLLAAARGRPFTVISRSDSTLRGHYPAETDAIASVLGAPDLTVIAPYFEAGGRFTIDDEHHVAEGGALVRACDTPFAHDAVFGYTTSNLPRWVEEKTSGVIRAGDVRSIPLETIRGGGPDAVEAMLLAPPRGSVCVVNACAPRDIEVFAAAALRLEAAGRSVLYRTAAAFVAARLGREPPPPLDAVAFAGAHAGAGGLVVVGSHVPRTTTQLARLQARLPVEAVEVAVDELLAGPPRLGAETARAIGAMNAAITAGRDALVFTSRRLVTGTDETANLGIGRIVSDALIAIVRGLAVQPRFLIAKGGITSSDVATAGLGVKRALVLGQILPGVPVWRLGIDARFPGLAYVIFPGNVGGPDALADAVTRARGGPRFG